MWYWRRPAAASTSASTFSGNSFAKATGAGISGSYSVRHTKLTLGPDAAVEARERRVHQGARRLARPVRAEVEKHDRIAVPHPPRAGRHRLHELVGDAGCIRGRHDLNRRRVRARLGGHDGAPRTFDALPAVVAVHGVVASGDCCRSPPCRCRRKARAPPLPAGFEVAGAALRRHVPAVHEAVHHDMRHTRRLRGAHEGMQVPVRRVDAPVGDKPHEVQRRARLARRRETPRQAPGSPRASRPRRRG